MPKLLSALAVLLVSATCLNAGAQVDFGSVELSESVIKDVTVTVPSATSFTSIAVYTLGGPLDDFHFSEGGTCGIGFNYAAGDTCTVRVTFGAGYPGFKIGAVVLHSSATNVFARTYLQGTVLGDNYAYNPSQAFAIGLEGSSQTVYSAASLRNPQFPALDGNGSLFVFDPTVALGAITKIANVQSVLIPRGPNGEAPGETINGIAIDGAGNRIIVGTNNAFSMPPGANIGQVFTDSYAGPAKYAAFSAAAVDGAGNLYLLDTAYGDIVEFPGGDSQATPIHYQLAAGTEPMDDATGLAVDAAGDMYVADTGNNRIVEFPAGGGTPLVMTPTAGGKPLNFPRGLALDGAGNLYICDTGNKRVVEIPVGNGAASVIAPVVNKLALGRPAGITVDPLGNLYVADPDNARVVQVARLKPPAFTFASTRVGVASSDSPKVIQVQNIGTTQLDFAGLMFPPDFTGAPSANACTTSTLLDIGQTCDLNLTFKPLSAGKFVEKVQVGTLPFYDTSTIQVSGNASNVQLSPSTLNYGSQAVGVSSASQSLTLTNYGATPILVSGIGTGSALFVFASDCYASLGTGQSCTIHGHFTPAGIGPETGTLTVKYNGADSPQTVALSGTGILSNSAHLSATSLSFGTRPVGSASTSQHVTLTNAGADAISIKGIRITGTDASAFIIGYDCPATLPADQSCTIHGHFTPTATGTQTATISITDNAPGSPQMITLTGTGQ